MVLVKVPLKIITGSVIPDAGSVMVNGVDVLKEPLKVQRVLGYLPEHNPQYLELYIKEYLEYVASIYKVDTSRVSQVIDMVVLGPEQHKRLVRYPKVSSTRGLAAALIPDPQILILDEPTTV